MAVGVLLRATAFFTPEGRLFYFYNFFVDGVRGFMIQYNSSGVIGPPTLTKDTMRSKHRLPQLFTLRRHLCQYLANGGKTRKDIVRGMGGGFREATIQSQLSAFLKSGFLFEDADRTLWLTDSALSLVEESWDILFKLQDATADSPEYQTLVKVRDILRKEVTV